MSEAAAVKIITENQGVCVTHMNTACNVLRHASPCPTLHLSGGQAVYATKHVDKSNQLHGSTVRHR